MANSDTTKGKGANGGVAKRPTSGASPATTPAKNTATAKKTATAAPLSPPAGGAGTGSALPAGEGTAVAKKSPARKTAPAAASAPLLPPATGGGPGAAPATSTATAKKSSTPVKKSAKPAKKRSTGATAVAATAVAAAAAGVAAGAAGAAKKRSSGGASKPRGGAAKAASGLAADLRDFVTRFREWGHSEWLGLLEELRGKGHDVADTQSVGMQLERERLASRLEGVEGMTAKRVQAVVGRYGTLYSLRQASTEELAGVSGMNFALAETVKQQV
ncbi:MAG TPA: hypothetical protein VF263_16180 [Longimicrobiaceae bacterium]